jgi:hypothetical protein
MKDIGNGVGVGQCGVEGEREQNACSSVLKFVDLRQRVWDSTAESEQHRMDLHRYQYTVRRLKARCWYNRVVANIPVPAVLGTWYFTHHKIRVEDTTKMR